MSYFEDLLNQVKQRPSKVEQAATYKILEETTFVKELVKPSTTKESFTPKESFASQQIASTHNRLNHKDAIFRIFAPQAKGVNVGSGFFYAPEGKFLTDLHVIGDANTLEIKLNNGQQLTGVVEKRDRATDLATGYIVDTKTQLPYLMIDNSRPLETYKGTTYVAGYAYGTDFQFLPGKFRKMSYVGIASDGDLELGENPSRSVILSNHFTPRAMSGGVIFDENYLPIGIIDKGDILNKGQSSTTISTPIGDALNLIKKPRTYNLDAKL